MNDTGKKRVESLCTSEINTGKVCPYCGSKTQFVDSVVIYGKSYGMVYLCEPCKAWVGVHKGTDKALGRLANEELREWKKKAHDLFDELWMRKVGQGFSYRNARTLAYKWLSDQMKIRVDQTHIGMFDVDRCKNVVELCSKYCNRIT
jgi:hypothetical protein